jgi:hypothetical protein
MAERRGLRNVLRLFHGHLPAAVPMVRTMQVPLGGTTRLSVADPERGDKSSELKKWNIDYIRGLPSEPIIVLVA